jgi:hypothetical protein
LFSYLIEKAGEVDGWMLHDMDCIICECVTWHWYMNMIQHVWYEYDIIHIT